MIPTYIINAALSPRSASRTALQKALRNDILVYSDKTLKELYEKMHLSRFDKYLSFKQRMIFYYDYEMNAYPIMIRHTIKACRDPKDDKFLELAKSAFADCIVSKDEDLLVLHPFEGIPILNVSAFLNRF